MNKALFFILALLALVMVTVQAGAPVKSKPVKAAPVKAKPVKAKPAKAAAAPVRAPVKTAAQNTIKVAVTAKPRGNAQAAAAALTKAGISGDMACDYTEKGFPKLGECWASLTFAKKSIELGGASNHISITGFEVVGKATKADNTVTVKAETAQLTLLGYKMPTTSLDMLVKLDKSTKKVSVNVDLKKSQPLRLGGSTLDSNGKPNAPYLWADNATGNVKTSDISALGAYEATLAGEKVTLKMVDWIPSVSLDSASVTVKANSLSLTVTKTNAISWRLKQTAKLGSDVQDVTIPKMEITLAASIVNGVWGFNFECAGKLSLEFIKRLTNAVMAKLNQWTKGKLKQAWIDKIMKIVPEKVEIPIAFKHKTAAFAGFIQMDGTIAKRSKLMKISSEALPSAVEKVGGFVTKALPNGLTIALPSKDLGWGKLAEWFPLVFPAGKIKAGAAITVNPDVAKPSLKLKLGLSGVDSKDDKKMGVPIILYKNADDTRRFQLDKCELNFEVGADKSKAYTPYFIGSVDGGATMRFPKLNSDKVKYSEVSLLLSASLNLDTAGVTFEISTSLAKPWNEVFGIKSLSFAALGGSIRISPLAAATGGVEGFSWRAKVLLGANKKAIDSVGQVSFVDPSKFAIALEMDAFTAHDLITLVKYDQPKPVWDFKLAGPVAVMYANPLGSSFEVFGYSFVPGLYVSLKNLPFLGIGRFDLETTARPSPFNISFSAKLQFNFALIDKVFNSLSEILFAKWLTPAGIPKFSLGSIIPIESIEISKFGIWQEAAGGAATVQSPGLLVNFSQKSWFCKSFFKATSACQFTIPSVSITLDPKALIVALGTYIVDKIPGGAVEFVKKLWVAIKEGITNASKAIVDMASKVGQSIKSNVKAIGDKISKGFSAASDWVKKLPSLWIETDAGRVLKQGAMAELIATMDAKVQEFCENYAEANHELSADAVATILQTIWSDVVQMQEHQGQVLKSMP